MTYQCERGRRQAGLPAQLLCQICRFGPCHCIEFQEPSDFTPRQAVNRMRLDVPNRLHGAAVNAEGDAI